MCNETTGPASFDAGMGEGDVVMTTLVPEVAPSFSAPPTSKKIHVEVEPTQKDVDKQMAMGQLKQQGNTTLPVDAVDAEKTERFNAQMGETAEPAATTAQSLDLGENPNVEYTVACKGSVYDGDYDPENSLAIPMVDQRTAERLISESPNAAPGQGKAVNDWASAQRSSVEHYVAGNSFAKSLERPGSEWKQAVDDKEAGPLRAVRPRMASTADGQHLTGEAALHKLNGALSLGTMTTVPLWSSGMWVSIKAPSNAALLTLDRMIAEEKVFLGRQTNGMVYSNLSVYLRKHIVDLILDCVYDASVTDPTRENLKSLIKVSDYQTLLWGLLCTIHPNGYKLSQPCVSSVGKCFHVTQEIISIGKLCWTDNGMISATQRAFMADRGTKRKTVDEVLAYQEEFAETNKKTVVINDAVSVNLKVPNLRDDLANGMGWVDGIVNMVDEAFVSTPISDKARNLRIAEQARVSALRQYESWISSILMTDASGVSIIDDPATISATCESFTSSKKTADTLFKAIGEYIDDSAVSVIGIPNFYCPACNNVQVDKQGRHPNIIPLDVEQVFFTLTLQKTNQLIKQNHTF